MNIKNVVKLKEGETVIRVVRNSWIAYFFPSFLAFFLIAAPFFFMIPLFSLQTLGVSVFLFSIAAGSIYGLRVFVSWYWNAFVITSQRVVDIDQRGFLSRTVSEATYDKIQDVSFSIKGFWGTLCNFGIIVVQTAGATTNLELPSVDDPKEIHHLITETMASHHHQLNGGARSERVAALLDAASDLNDTEARAFLVALQEAILAGKKQSKDKPVDVIDVWTRRSISEK